MHVLVSMCSKVVKVVLSFVGYGYGLFNVINHIQDNDYHSHIYKDIVFTFSDS